MDPVDVDFIKTNFEYHRGDISKMALEDKDSLDQFLLIVNEPMLMVYDSSHNNVDHNKVRAVICGPMDIVCNTNLGKPRDDTLGVWVRSAAQILFAVASKRSAAFCRRFENTTLSATKVDKVRRSSSS